jgi:hypothetical protein
VRRTVKAAPGAKKRKGAAPRRRASRNSKRRK